MNRTRNVARAVQPSARAIPQILKDLRSLRVCVFHPQDQDGEGLTRQLQRIGCQVQAFWPPLPLPPAGTDLVFMALHPNILQHDFSWCAGDSAPPVIAVITYENPTIIEAVLRIGAKGVVASPVRSFGLLSSLVLARELTTELVKQRRRISRLEEKLVGVRKIAEAQDILCQQRGITKDDAYKVIREQAMSKRVTAEDIASAIINANEILSFKAREPE
ncbi:ANTAR domain-containing response regulator [Paraburkholderia oxyphila]|uniref:ANTAR domain-containing response regulator n=1 Tax=Paraburkholderia oxyphila TaxID=614212 RepID=UPI000488B6E9|nr:ANTAR domain-containing protein [Paraburkholderia oxyphila]